MTSGANRSGGQKNNTEVELSGGQQRMSDENAGRVFSREA